MEDQMLEVQEKINDAELMLCDLLNTGELDPDQTEDAKRMIEKLEDLQIECMGFS